MHKHFSRIRAFRVQNYSRLIGGLGDVPRAQIAVETFRVMNAPRVQVVVEGFRVRKNPR